MFMNSGRPKSAVFKFKVWPQKRSQMLFCNPAQNDKTISNNFHEDNLLKF